MRLFYAVLFGVWLDEFSNDVNIKFPENKASFSVDQKSMVRQMGNAIILIEVLPRSRELNIHPQSSYVVPKQH